jgi:hypothetical protein
MRFADPAWFSEHKNGGRLQICRRTLRISVEANPTFDFVSRKANTMAKTAPLKKKGGKFEIVLSL